MATPLFPLIVSCLALGAHAAAMQAGPIVEVPLRRLVSPLLAAPVSVAGQERWFILDTATKGSLITSRFANELGLRPRARFEVVSPLGGAREAVCAGPLTLRIGSVPLSVACLGWVPSEPEIIFPSGASGILGVDALRNVEVLLDARRARLWLAPRGSLVPLVAGEIVALRDCDGLPAVAGDVRRRGERGRRPALLVVDSAASGPLLFGAVGQALASVGGPAENFVVATAAGSAVKQAAVIEISVGGRRLRPGSAVLLPDVRDREADGLLPATLLGRFLLDLPGSRVVLGADWIDEAAEPAAAPWSP